MNFKDADLCFYYLLSLPHSQLIQFSSSEGALEFKLFVGSLNKQATEKEVEEVCLIFLPFEVVTYGRLTEHGRVLNLDIIVSLVAIANNFK